jgi:hypothetical protein
MLNHPRAASCRWIALAMCCAGAAGYAQASSPADADLAELQAQRFPQPVRVGDLIGRQILAPLESRPILGSVVAVVREPQKTLAIVMKHGGFLGFGGRLIAVPAAAIGLVGKELMLVDLTPEQLDARPTFVAGDAVALAADEEIHMGLAHPAH